MSKSKTSDKFTFITIEQQVDEIIEALNEFSNMNNNKNQINLIEDTKKYLTILKDDSSQRIHVI